MTHTSAPEFDEMLRLQLTAYRSSSTANISRALARYLFLSSIIYSICGCHCHKLMYVCCLTHSLQVTISVC